MATQTPIPASDAASALREAVAQRVLVLCAGVGTGIQRREPKPEDFHGERFKDHPRALVGCNDILSLTRQDIVAGVHDEHLAAGADLIETNTFTATRVSLEDYGLEDCAREINLAGARLAREAVDRAHERDPDHRRFVIGSIGPTNRTASISPDVERPAFRAVTFDVLFESYREQADALIEGGVDVLVVETSFDTLNLKAGLEGVRAAQEARGTRLPVIASITITDDSGRTLSGQTVEAAWRSIQHFDLFAVGLNCALGPEKMRAHIQELAHLAPIATVCYPNAGLPNAMGEYDLTPETMAEQVRPFAAEGFANIVGGCCGTTSEHIAAIAEAVRGIEPRVPPEADTTLVLSGLEPYTIERDRLHIVGERTNVSGSRKFARLIRDHEHEEALEVARTQVDGGANLLDVNLDDGLLEVPLEMRDFLNLVAGEPDVAKLPIIVDSSEFRVIETGLKCTQGRGLANSISLKDGEETFREQARVIRRLGASPIAMAFDEDGQATTADRKLEILSRAARILIDEIGFKEHEIVFDPIVLTIATGMSEHDRYGLEFIEGVRRLRERFPAAHVIGGVSNLSFSFRGNNTVRSAINSVFLYHAGKAGLNIAIVNAGHLSVYEAIDAPLRDLIEDVLFCRREGAVDQLVERAQQTDDPAAAEAASHAWEEQPVEDRIRHAVIHGITSRIVEDVEELRAGGMRPLSIIEGPLMDAMGIVGDLFGEGKMFLPQVVKSARVMRRAVTHLEPFMDAEAEASGTREPKGRVVMATVKGDVHDIGKNIVGVVLRCNGFEVIDLGVMTPAEKILEAAIEHDAHIVGLSGLITPSLHEMVHVAGELEAKGIGVPLLIGGATTSLKHTSLKISPAYSGPTVHVRDASRAVTVASKLVSKEYRERFVREVEEEHEKQRERGTANAPDLVPYADACAKRPQITFSPETVATHAHLGVREVELAVDALAPLIDWGPFFHAWEMRGSFPAILDKPEIGPVARKLYDEAREMLARIASEGIVQPKGVYGFWGAASDGDDVIVYADEAHMSEKLRFHMLRQQRAKVRDTEHRSLADYIAPTNAEVRDHLGLFAVTAGVEGAAWANELKQKDDYEGILAEALLDRLAEAAAEYVHRVARQACGIDEDLTPDDLIREKYRGIRPAPGYPACPDHTEKGKLFDLLGASAATGITLTESFAMHPGASVCGFVFTHPESAYFAVGPIGEDQLASYAERRGVSLDEARRWLAPNLLG